MEYKLRYESKKQAIEHLHSLGITDEQGSFNQREISVVYLGQIVNEPATFDEDGNVLTEPTYIDGYHVDVLSNNNINFGNYEINPRTDKHIFA